MSGPDELHLSPDDCRLIVYRRLGHQDFEFQPPQVHAILDSDKDVITGLMSEQVKVSISVKEVGAQSSQTLNFFAKYVPSQWKLRKELVAALGMFEREASFYNQRHLWLSPDAKYLPTCYLATDDVVILQDMLELHFQTVHPLHPLDYDHCSLVLSALADFHAASLAFEKKNSTPQRVYKMYDDPRFDFSNKKLMDTDALSKIWVDSVFSIALKLVEKLPEFIENPALIQKVKNRLPKLSYKASLLIVPSDRYRCAMLHYDLWSSNILFRYDAESKRPVDVTFVDFQQVVYAPPAMEVMMFLYMTTSPEFRDYHLQLLVDWYYGELVRALKLRGFQSEDVMPRDHFDKSCEDCLLWGRMSAFMYCASIYLPPGALSLYLRSDADFERFITDDKEAVTMRHFLHNEMYRRRVCDALYEFLNKCVLV